METAGFFTLPMQKTLGELGSLRDGHSRAPGGPGEGHLHCFYHFQCEKSFGRDTALTAISNGIVADNGAGTGQV